MKQNMKKIFVSLLLLLLTLPLLAGTRVQAETAAADDSAHVIDKALLFSVSAHVELERRMEELENKYATKVIILTTNKLEDEALSGRQYSGIQAFAEDYYDYVVCGGVETTGIILAIDMGSRKMWVSTTGDEVGRFQSDIDYLLDRVASRLSDGENDAAALKFVQLVEQKHKWGFYPPTAGKILLSIGIGLLVALIVVAGLKSQLKTVQQATSAHNYTVPGSFHLRRINELFLYSSVTQTAKPQPQERGVGGGGFGGSGSSGFSHGGGGRTF